MHPMPRYPSLPAAFALLLALLSATGTAAAEPPAKPTTQAAAAEAPGVVNLNTASEAELMRLPGVGPKKAQAILALRERVKQFKRIEALMRVKGIGRKTFRKLRPMLTLEGETTLAPAKRTRRSR